MEAHAYKVLAATGNAKEAPGVAVRVVLTGGSDAATAILYDDTDGTSNPILTICAAAATTVSVDVGVPCSTGIRVALTGTSPSCTVFYR
jgi:hypothetical protein